MTLDIVIPVLNEEQNLQSLLPFLLDELAAEKAVITVVDAKTSKDNASKVCEEYGVNYLKSEYTQRSKQLNEGAFSGEMDCLLFLHADVTPPKDFYNLIKLKLAMGYYAGCFSYKFKEDNLLLKINSYCTRFNSIFTGGGDQGLYIIRTEFEKLEGFCEQHQIMEDFELYDRLKKQNIPFTIIKNNAVVSNRKYKRNSWLRVNLVNLTAFINYKIYHDPNRTYFFYKKWLKN